MALLNRDAPYSDIGMGSWAPNVSQYGFTFTGADPPTGLIEDEGGTATALAGGLVASISRSGAGIYVVTLTSAFKFIRGHGSCDVTLHHVNVRTTTEGGGTAGVVTVEVLTAGAAADPAGKVRVVLELVKAVRLKG
jgi:hypothetical protein